MKKSGIIFFELVLIILLFACATNTTDIKTYKVTEDRNPAIKSKLQLLKQAVL
jgi:hypothetical protein